MSYLACTSLLEHYKAYSTGWENRQEPGRGSGLEGAFSDTHGNQLGPTGGYNEPGCEAENKTELYGKGLSECIPLSPWGSGVC